MRRHHFARPRTSHLLLGLLALPTASALEVTLPAETALGHPIEIVNGHRALVRNALAAYVAPTAAAMPRATPIAPPSVSGRCSFIPRR